MKKSTTSKIAAGIFILLALMFIGLSANLSAQCIADFTWAQSASNEITFTNTSTGGGSYSWWFGDDNYSTATNPVHIYNIPGTYTVYLSLYDSACADSISYQVTVTGVVICNVTATAYQTAHASCGTCADGAAYAYLSGGTGPYTYLWNTIPPQTTYNATGLSPGTYTVCITDVYACSACASVTIDTSLCVADFTWVQSANNEITFTNTSGSGSYSWIFGDGNSSNATNPVHFYNIPGTYTVYLSMYDSTCSDSVSHQVTVTGVVICNVTAVAYPTALASCGTCADGSAQAYLSGGTVPYTYLWNTIPPQTTYTATGLLPGTYTVCITDANACSDCATVTIDTTTCNADFTWVQTANNTITFTNTTAGAGGGASYTWSFGDGSNFFYGTNPPPHFYQTPGTYTVCLGVNDSICSDSICQVVTVTGIPCNITITTTSTNASCASCSDGNATVAATGGAPPYSYLWSTGATTQSISGLLPGNYQVCVTDTLGCTQCAYVSVISVIPCQAYFMIFPDSITPHMYWGYNQSIGTPPITYLWSWGDGNYSSGAYPSHTYASAGYYTICLTLTDSSGCSSTYCDSMNLLRGSSAMAIVTINIVQQGGVGIVENQLQNELYLFPNPSTDEVTVGNFSADMKIISAGIFDAIGNLVAEERMTGNKFDVRNIPQGVYLAKVLFEDGKYYSTRLVIVR